MSGFLHLLPLGNSSLSGISTGLHRCVAVGLQHLNSFWLPKSADSHKPRKACGEANICVQPDSPEPGQVGVPEHQHCIFALDFCLSLRQLKRLCLSLTNQTSTLETK